MAQTLEQFTATRKVTLLVVGDSGVGKTGGLASLVDAGYNLYVIDLEAKLDPLAQHIKDKSKLSNVHYETLKDAYKISGSSLVIGKAPSFQRAMGLLGNWPDKGPVDTWGDKDVLVIDTLGALGRASLNMVLQANGNPTQVGIQHYGTAMENIEKLLDNITSPLAVPCHLVVLSHITAQEQEGTGVLRLYPEALGSKLNPKVARKFDNMISLSLTAGKKSYKTQKDGILACKTARPIKPDYPLETGMADIFRDLLA